MSEPGDKLWMILAMPLLGAIIIAALGRSALKDRSGNICVGTAAVACLFSFFTLFGVLGSEAPMVYRNFTWFQAGNVDVSFTLRADALTAVMLVMITFIGTLIAIFSTGYMKGDPGYPRFFAAFSLFLFFMTGLVLASNFIVLYLCWEGVGLCSFLLIGFWFQRPSAADAARKAFLVTRLGDICLFLGILTLWHYGSHSLEFTDIFSDTAIDAYQRAGVLQIACLLLFVGAAGKSAQFPLHVWLPDAMEGPTPVSALIHAATMVTAGVYLVARCMPLFGQAPEALLTVACIGGFTAILAALIAVTQTDLKRVLAYSTLSQLGYMFLGLGCAVMVGDHSLATVAVVAGMFHLFTHAFFKALLFLAAGSVMHAMGDVIDMRRFSGLRTVLPTTHWTFACGAAALAGFPLLSGFWSKDEILAVAFQARADAVYGNVYLFLFLLGMLTAAITAFYTARAYFMTFWGEVRIPPEAFSHTHGGHDAHGHDAHGHAPAAAAEHQPGEVHDSPPVMTVPLMILAAGAIAVGILFGPTELFGGFLYEHWMNQTWPQNLLHEGHEHIWLLMIVSSLVALGGIGVAYLMYVRQPSVAEQIARSMATMYEASRNKFYIDEIYEALIVGPLTALAHVLRIFDQYVVDGLVDLIGQLPALLGTMLRPAQNGLVQFYALLMVLGVTGFVVAMLLR